MDGRFDISTLVIVLALVATIWLFVYWRRRRRRVEPKTNDKTLEFVFISYARSDASIAKTLAAALAAKGYNVWWDINLVGSDEFRDEIQAKLRAAKAVIVIWSPQSVASRFVRQEADEALQFRKLISTRVRGLALLDIPIGFREQHTDYVDEKSKVIAALNKLMSVSIPANRTFEESVPETPEGLHNGSDSDRRALSGLADRLAKRRYDCLGHTISLLDIFVHARVKLNRYVSISYPAMDILRELDHKKMVPSSLSTLAQKDKWQTDEASRVVIKDIGERMMLDCQELGVVEISRSDFHEPEYVITTLGLRLANYLDDLSVRQAKAFEAGRLLMGTFLELQLNSAYDANPYIERARQYLSDLGATHVKLDGLASGISSETIRSLTEQVHRELSSCAADVVPYYEAALHLFMTLPKNDKAQFKATLDFIDIPRDLKEERTNVMEWLAALRSHFEGRLFPK